MSIKLASARAEGTSTRERRDAPAAAGGDESRDEQALIAAIRMGDARAFERVFHTYYRPLCAFMQGYVGSREVAEEYVQDVLCWVWEQRAEWTVRSGLRSYLYGAVRNRGLNYLKHRRIARAWEGQAASELPISGLGQGPITVEDAMRARELVAALHVAVERLPARRRQAFTLRWQHRMSNREIADVMGISEKGVEIAVTKALRTLREALASFF